jgi:hypothetical protein
MSNFPVILGANAVAKGASNWSKQLSWRKIAVTLNDRRVNQ